MAQHDYNIANQSGAAFRADLNNALSAIVSQNSGAAEPSTTFAYQLWADTTAGVLKIRNAANSAWITLRELDGTLIVEDGSASTPALAFASDLNTGIYRIDADRLGVATGGTLRLEVNASGQLMAGYAGAVGTPTFTKNDDGNTGLWFPAADTLAISTAGAEVARATSDAYLRMATSTGGIQFNGDTAAVNALDDYEEGTFTPTIIGTSTSGTGTYTTQVGRYTKIGNRVAFEIALKWTAHTGTGNMRAAGLPFTSNTNSGFVPMAVSYDDLASPSSSFVQAEVENNSTEVRIRSNVVATGVASALAIDTDASFRVQGTYEV